MSGQKLMDVCIQLYLIVLMMLLQIKAKMSADGLIRPGDRYVRWGIILPIAL